MRKVALELQPCCGRRSGIGQYTYEIAKRLRDSDGLVFRGNLFNFLSRNDNTESLAGIEMPILVNSLFPYGVYRRIWNAIPLPYDRLFRPKADLNVFFNYIVPPSIEGKTMTTIHDMTYLRFPETMDRRNLKRLQDGIEYSVARSAHIVTDSEFSKQEIMQLLNIPLEKISVVPGAPSLTDRFVDFSEMADKYHIDKPYILYVGTIEPRKNLVRLMQAFAALKKNGFPHQLVLAGGKGWENEDIYQTADRLFHYGEIVFTGYISDAEKNTLYQNAEAFVFPSLYEGFGIPPLEAMHFGCPVVCANAASLPEVVGDAAQLVDPMEVDSIAEGMLRVLADEPYRMKLVQSGYAQAKKFNWDDSANKLTQICREVLEES
nr:glycosyltransferase family 1 protein [uncultured Agathobaculum sp.]